jgi:hypothetical protein
MKKPFPTPAPFQAPQPAYNIGPVTPTQRPDPTGLPPLTKQELKLKKRPIRDIPTSKPMSHKPISTDDVSYILDSYLHKKHRQDPTVLTFLNSYVVCRDVRQASADAGITSRSGHALRNRKDIAKAIVKITDIAVYKSGIDPEAIVKRVLEVVEIDLAEFQNEDGSYKNSLTDIPPEIRRAIKKIKLKNTFDKDANGMSVITGEIIEIEVYDKLKGVELLGREVGKFKETKVLEHGVTKDMGALLLGSRQRADAAIEGAIDVTPGEES